MLWTLILAVGGFFLFGPVGAIIGLLFGIVVAIVSNGNSHRRLERRLEALAGGGEGSAPQANTFGIAIGVVAIGTVIGIAAVLGATDQDQPRSEGSTKAEAATSREGTENLSPARVAQAKPRAPQVRCHADGLFTGLSSLQECARQNAVAVDELQIGYDETWEPAAYASLELVDHVTTYAALLGFGVGCGIDVSQQSSQVGSWLDRMAEPGASEHQRHLTLMMTGMREGAIRQRSGRTGMDCAAVERAISNNPWPHS